MSLVSCTLLTLLQAAVAWDHVEWYQRGVKFLEENRQREGVIELPSGLQYEILESGPEDGRHPNETNGVACHYRGYLIDGKEFDASHWRGKPTTFRPNQVVSGWTEALLMMRPGDKWKIWIPAEIAYEHREAGGVIPPYSLLIFDLELIEVHDELPEIDIWQKATNIWRHIKRNPKNLILDGLVPLLILVGWHVYKNYTHMGQVGEACPVDFCVNHKNNIQVFMEIKVADDEPKRVVFNLFHDFQPKTVENFRALCTGEKGEGKQGKPLHYKGTTFHRIIPGSMCQGGDIIKGNGTGGESIYGDKFKDEWTNGHICHTESGLLSMANSGKNTNASQFFITLSKCSHLDQKHVVFGQVLEGMEVIREMEKVGSGDGTPQKKVVITDCGEIKEEVEDKNE